MAASFRKSAAASQAAMAAGRLNNEGIKLENAGNLAGALLKYRSALDLDPTQSVFHLNCGLVLCQLGRFEEGIAEIREALELEPGNVKATKALYVALERQQRAMMKK